jgi:hypothetical protein
MLSFGITISLTLVFFACLLAPVALSQTVVGPGQPKVIDAKFQGQVIDSVTKALNEAYVFPDVAKKMERLVRKQYKANAYKDITDLSQFAQRLTVDLQSVSKDLHLRVGYLPSDSPEFSRPDSLTEEDAKRLADQAAYDNFAFEKVEHLPGNIGYLKFNQFVGAEYAGGTAIAAMSFLAHSDALIIDLRDNGGGEPSMIQLITSYFFDQPVHLNDFYIRKSDSYEQYWSAAYVVGPRLTKADIYVLTSGNTFSGAEEFSYNLKTLKRATIIGETTGGGAHPINYRVFHNLNVRMSLPFGRAINPITKTNWEGVGVKPDIEVPRDQAFDVAYLKALKGVLAKTTDPDKHYALNWAVEGKEAVANPYRVDAGMLQQYVGAYGPRAITLENGSLYYQRQDRPKFKLVPVSADKFMLDGLATFRIQFVRDSAGVVTDFVGLYNTGFSDRNPKNK